MDADELRVVISAIEETHVAYVEQLSCLRDELQQRRCEEVCVSRGPHEYKDVSPGNVPDKRCKFCGKLKEPA